MSDSVQQSQRIDAASDDDAALGRIATRMALGGFALMFVAAALMWMSVGPSIFVDLATAVMNCL